jgi:transposase
LLACERPNNWTDALVRALEYICGVPAVIVPENAKALIAEPDCCEPQASATIEDLSRQYGTTILPARPYRPQGKANASYYLLC